MKKIILILLSLFQLPFSVLAAEPEYLKVDPKEYNYEFFHVYAGRRWGRGINFVEGSKFPDARLYHTGRKEYVNLYDIIKDKPVVLELGSVTCASFTGSLPKMAELQKRFGKNMDFYTLYVRENHPRDRINFHTSMEQKIAAAADYEQWKKPAYPTLVDSLDGDLHQKLGSYPNAIFVIGPDKKLLYRTVSPKMENLQAILELVQVRKRDLASMPFIDEGTFLMPGEVNPGYEEESKRVYDRAGLLIANDPNGHDKIEEMRSKHEKEANARAEKFQAENDKKLKADYEKTLRLKHSLTEKQKRSVP